MNEPIASPSPFTRDDITGLLNFFRATGAEVQKALSSEPVRQAIAGIDAITKAATSWIGEHQKDIRLAIYNHQLMIDRSMPPVSMLARR